MMLKALLHSAWSAVFLLLAAFVLLLTVNLGFLRPRIEAQTSALLGQKVVIGNDIKFRLVGGRPALLLHDVAIGRDIKADSVDLALRGLHPSRALFVRADDLHIDGRPLGDADLPLAILPDGFVIDPLRGRLKNATLSGRVSYAGGTLAVDGRAAGLPLALFLGDSAQGDLDAVFRLQSKGDTMQELLKNLAGRFMLTSNGGTLTSSSLRFWSNGLLSSLLPGNEDKTALNCAILDFNVDQGIADSRAIVVDTRDNTIFARGRIDLADGTIDMLVTPHPKDMQLVSLATPVKVTGRITDATVTPDADGVATKIGGMLLGVINPAFALLPLMQSGFDDYKGSCAAILKQRQSQKQ